MPSWTHWAAVALALAVACSSSPHAATSAPTPVPARSDAGPASATGSGPELPSECGELALEARVLEADGKGEAHPRRIAVEQALAECSDRRPSASACQRVVREVTELMRRGYGSRHPEMVASSAGLELCRATFGSAGIPTPPAPTAEECAALPDERARLLRDGKGERHPAVLALDARLAECAASTPR